MERVLVINPGQTSTKFAVYDGENVVLKKTVEHQGDELKKFSRIFDQHEYRLNLILDGLADAGIELNTLNAVVGRGGLLKAMPSGTTAVNDLMVKDLENAEAEHASNLGAVLALDLSKKLGIPAFIVDPVSVDEMIPEAKVSGLPELSRISMSHALNMKAVARKVAADIGKKFSDANIVVAHLGTGVSLSAHTGGRMIDVVDGKEEGAFSPDRCGGLPAYQLVKLCFSGKYTLGDLKKKLFGSGGFAGYLGVRDIREVEKMAGEGNEKAELLIKALIYQVAKDIGGLCTVLSGNVDRIVLTGGIAYSKRIVDGITARVKFMAPVAVVAGEEELNALAEGALRVLRGEETANVYK